VPFTVPVIVALRQKEPKKIKALMRAISFSRERMISPLIDDLREE
jgi:hypothetical protein